MNNLKEKLTKLAPYSFLGIEYLEGFNIDEFMVNMLVKLTDMKGDTVYNTVNPSDPTNMSIWTAYIGLHQSIGPDVEDEMGNPEMPGPEVVELKIIEFWGSHEIRITGKQFDVIGMFCMDAKKYLWVKLHRERWATTDIDSIAVFRSVVLSLFQDGEWINESEKKDWPVENFEDPMGCPSMYK